MLQGPGNIGSTGYTGLTGNTGNSGGTGVCSIILLHMGSNYANSVNDGIPYRGILILLSAYLKLTCLTHLHVCVDARINYFTLMPS